MSQIMSKKTKTIKTEDTKEKTHQDFPSFYAENTNQMVQVAPGVEYSIIDVMTENRRFFHSMFKTPKTPTGLKKIFYNTGYIYYSTLYKHTDLDFKDMDCVATNDIGLVAAPTVRSILQSYVSKANYAGQKPDRVINQVRESLLQDGVVYLKLVGDTPYVVDSFNIIEPANQDGLGAMIEKIANKSPEQTEDLYGSDLDDDVKAKFDNVLKEAREEGKNPILFEYWVPGKTPRCEVWISETFELPVDFKDQSQWEFAFKIASFDSPARDQFGNRTFPYAKEHNIHVRGRRIGFSVFEITKGVIYNYQELMNMNREKSLLDLRGLFIFKKGFNSRAIPQSFMNKVGLGGFLETEAGEEIERLPYQYVANEVMAVADNLFNTGRQLAGTTSMDVGDQLPSRVSATAVVDNRKNAQTSYDVTIESMSILLSDFMERLWAPTILRKLTKEKAIAIKGSLSEIEDLDKIVITQGLYEEMHKVKKDYGFYGVIINQQPAPIHEQWEIDAIIDMRLSEMTGDTRFIDVKDALIKSLQYSVKFIVGAERIDKENKIQTLITWRQTAQNPFTAEKLDMRIADLVGEDPKLFKLTPAQMALAIQMTQGGQQGAQGAQNQTGQPLSPEVNSPNRML